MNNCHGRNHEYIYGEKAFYDLETTGVQARMATNLQKGQKCIVASRDKNLVIFRWYEFMKEDIKIDDRGVPCRVFFGNFLNEVEMPLMKAVNTEPYSNFFDVNQHFKRRSAWVK